MTEQRSVPIEQQLAALTGAPFTKMTGSGNDFVVFDAREVQRERVEVPEVIRAICNRHNGIGADGVVVLEPRDAQASCEVTRSSNPDEHADKAGLSSAPILLRYFNSDGSLGELCGNATLCSTTLAVFTGLAPAERVLLDTDSGRVSARVAAGEPQIDLAPVRVVRAEQPLIDRLEGEAHVGFALVGVPHLVLTTTALDGVTVDARGRSIRQHPSLMPDGANVNWVAPAGDGRWAYRTYERGVEGETLACGTGAVAAAILLTTWGLATSPVRLITRSGRELEVTLRTAAIEGASEASWTASLRGEGRVVFRGQIGRLG